MVGIELDKLVWNLRDGSDPEILFIRNTSPQIFISVNFIFFLFSSHKNCWTPTEHHFVIIFFDETIAENQKADEPTRTYCTTLASGLSSVKSL